ncbi:MAG: rhodanese-like domain-containing protein [Phycisphaeraceae bacterium]
MTRLKHVRWIGTLSLMVLLAAGMLSTVWAQGSATKAGSTTKEPDKKKVEVKAELNAEALKALMAAKVPMVVLDARGPSEQWVAGAVPLAHDAEERAIRRALANPNQLVVNYCGGPECPMSLMLANRLAEHGYANVIRFTGGIEAWTKAELPLAKKDTGSTTKQQATPPAQGSAPRPSGSGSR